MKNSIWPWGLALAVALGGIATAVYVFTGRPAPPPTLPVEAPVPAVVSEPAPPPPALPPPPVAVEIPLPPLDESDATLREAFTDLLGGSGPVEQFLLPDEIVRHLVATIDNLPRPKVALQIRPTTPVAGEFQAAGGEDDLTLDPANFARYRPLVALLGSVDAPALVALYRRLWPLFQQAYDELGNPPQHLDARLIEVIDHLLDTPRVDGPIRLVRPSVFYQFADPTLEARSAGQKTLIRIGPENADIVKAKLRELRAALGPPRG